MTSDRLRQHVFFCTKQGMFVGEVGSRIIWDVMSVWGALRSVGGCNGFLGEVMIS